VSAGASGYFQPGDVATLRHASVATFLPKITIPTLLMQGENDTLFNLNEAVATYRALLAQHAPVKMVWQSWGHSGITPAPGELDLSHPDPGTQYETARILAWFDHYLKGKPVSTGPQFAYFQDWVQYSGIATPAYATSSAYPVGTAMHLYLSGSGALVSSPGAVTAGSQNMLTPAGGLPTSLSSLDAIGNYLGLPDANLPGTYASWQGQALTSNLDVVGEPTLTVQVQAPFAAATQGVGAAGELVVFAKIYDVGPDGKATLIHGLVAPVRVADVGKPIHIVLPAIVHRFAAGHHVEIMIAGGDVNYRGGLVPNLVTIPAGAGQVLSLPTVP
jgi:ABC-2 type transport system ATP-binding protein